MDTFEMLDVGQRVAVILNSGAAHGPMAIVHRTRTRVRLSDGSEWHVRPGGQTKRLRAEPYDTAHLEAFTEAHARQINRRRAIRQVEAGLRWGFDGVPDDALVAFGRLADEALKACREAEEAKAVKARAESERRAEATQAARERAEAQRRAAGGRR